MVAVPVALVAAAALASVGTAAYAGVSAANQAKAEANQADANQTIANQRQAALAQQQQQADDQAYAENNQRLGQIRALYGASGVDPTGSVLDVLQGNATQEAFSTRESDYAENLDRVATADQSSQFGTQAANARSEAASDLTTGMVINVGSAALGGASKTYTAMHPAKGGIDTGT